MSSSPSAPLVMETLDPIAIRPDRDELMRYLGYSPAAARQKSLPDVIEQALSLGREHLRPRGIYCICPVDAWQPDLVIFGGASLVGQVATFLRLATRIVAFIATVGQDITDLSRKAAAAGDMPVSWALDALGSWATEATVETLMTHVEHHLDCGEALSVRYSPGYCGLHLDQQTAIFRLLHGGAVGVSLLPSMLMQPLKSVSGVVGIGERSLIEPVGVPCQTCTAEHCTMRRWP